MSRARKRKRVDVRRLGEAVSYPGIDPRTWVGIALVEDEEDARTWDPELGWVVDVAMLGGDLDGETELPCRVSEGLGGDGYGEFLPPAAGCEVVVALPSGDPEESPVIVGRSHNARTAKAPATIHGLPISGDVETSSLVAVSPFDTEIKRSAYSRREEYEGERWHVMAPLLVLEATTGQVRLGSDEASQSAVLGDDYTEQLVEAVDGILGVLGSLTGPSTLPDLPTFIARWESVIKPALGAALSDRVKVE